MCAFQILSCSEFAATEDNIRLGCRDKIDLSIIYSIRV